MITPIPRRTIIRKCRVCLFADTTLRLWVADDLCLPCAGRLLERAARPDPMELLSLGRDPVDAA